MGDSLGFPTISSSSVSPFTLVLPSRANYWVHFRYKTDHHTNPNSNTTIGLGLSREDHPGRYNTNEIWVQPTHKGLTSLLTKNLKAMNLWVFILIWCSTFSFLLNVGLRLTLEIPTRDVNGASRVRVVAPQHPTRGINIYLVLVPYLRRVSVMRVPAYFFHIHGYPRYPRLFTKLF